MRAWPHRVLGATAAAALAACHPAERIAEPHEAAAVVEGWHYAVHIERDLASATVRLCFDAAPGDRLVAGDPAAADYVRDVRIVGTEQRLRRRGRTFELDAVEAGECIAYEVDFAEMARREGSGRRVRWVGASLLVRPSLWLWRPSRIPDREAISVRFDHDDALAVSVPWPVARGRRGEKGAVYALDSTVYAWLGYSVFGRMQVERFTAAGTAIELVVLDAPLAASPAGLRAWITDAADTVALLYGTFPRDRLQVVVVPVDGGYGTVYFGAAGRGGGPGVYILMDDDARDDELPGGWTTVHELLHHGMPFVDEAWMGEGWVSYYTEVMRTRMGHRSEQEGWQELYEAFVRGKNGNRPMTLARTSQLMHRTFAYQNVYWGGAAIAFFIDVALREDSGGKVSLDDAVQELRRCCGDARHRWSAQTLLEKLDTWYGKPLFTRIADEHLQSEAFPPVEATLQRLGISIEHDRVMLDDDHPGAAHRRAIMAPRTDRAATARLRTRADVR